LAWSPRSSEILASPSALYITGTNVEVDGGRDADQNHHPSHQSQEEKA